MRNAWLPAMLWVAVAAPPAKPAEVVIYKAAQLQGFGKQLAPKVDATKIAVQNLDNFGNHNSMVAHREGDGQVEIHQHYADLFVVVSGHATLLAGGKDESATQTEPGEFRGGAIVGGARHALGPGDIVHIPPNVPHQLLLDSGRAFTYFVLKVASN